MRLKALKEVLTKLGGTPAGEKTCGEVIEKIADKAGGGGLPTAEVTIMLEAGTEIFDVYKFKSGTCTKTSAELDAEPHYIVVKMVDSEVMDEIATGGFVSSSSGRGRAGTPQGGVFWGCVMSFGVGSDKALSSFKWHEFE